MKKKYKPTAEESKAIHVWESILRDTTLPPERHVEARSAIHALRRTGPLASVYEKLAELEAMKGGKGSKRTDMPTMKDLDTVKGQMYKSLRDLEAVMEEDRKRVDDLKSQVEGLAFALGGTEDKPIDDQNVADQNN